MAIKIPLPTIFFIFDEIMCDSFQEGYETDLGIIAILYQQIWSKAEMREIIMRIELRWV